MTQPIKAITSVLKASTDIITNIPACPTRLAEILAIMSVSTFKIAVTLYLLLYKLDTLLLKQKNLPLLDNMKQAQTV